MGWILWIIAFVCFVYGAILNEGSDDEKQKMGLGLMVIALILGVMGGFL